MKRSLSLLMLALLLLSALPAQAGDGGQRIEGTVTFRDISSFDVNATLYLDYAVIDGRNLSADEIRGLLNSGDERVESALQEMAESLFDSMLEPFSATGNLNTTISPGISGPVMVIMEGWGSAANSTCSSEIYRMLGESGAEFHFSLTPLGIPGSIEILPPENFEINGASSYLWDCSWANIVMSSEPARQGTIDIFFDIYHIDTSGIDQRIYLNIYLNATAYYLPYSGELPFEGIYAYLVGVDLAYTLMECGYLEENIWNHTLDSFMTYVRDRLMAEFPDIQFNESSWKSGEDRVLFNISANASIPVSSLMGASLSKMVSQSMEMKLYGTEGFVTTYSVLLPRGMLMNDIYLTPYCPHYVIYEADRYGFQAELDGDGVYTAHMTLGILIDFRPFMPLITAVLILTGMWFVVMHTVPARRR